MMYRICAVYRTDEGEPWVLPVVRSVEKQMAADMTLNHESLPEAGQFDFRLAGIRLLLGKDNVAVIQNRVTACCFQVFISVASITVSHHFTTFW